MAAIITDDFRRNQAKLLVDSIVDVDEATIYALGIGKSDPWPDNDSGASETDSNFTVTTPSGTRQEADDVLNNLISMKEISGDGAEQLVPKNTWASGNTYKAYDSTDNSCFYDDNDGKSCCVVDGDNIYLCISNIAGTSNTIGTTTGGQSPNTIVTTDYSWAQGTDGYVWAHVAQIPTSGSAEKFVTPQFVPVLRDADVTTLFGEIDTNDQAETGGLLSYIGVSDGGSGYSSPTATLSLVDEDGNAIDVSDIKLTPVLAAGVITKIIIQDSADTGAGSDSYWDLDSPSRVIKGARYGTVTITDSAGSGASAYPVIAPFRGYAKKAIDVLPTWYVGVTADFEDTEGGDTPILDFRQLSLIKRYTRSLADDGTSDSLDCLRYIYTESSVVNSGNNRDALVPGDILTDGTSKFYFDYYDNGSLYYHQNSNEDVNFITPTGAITYVSGPGTLTSGDGIATYSGAIGGEWDKQLSNEDWNGEVLFHENRVPFERADDQTEEIKLIIQL